MRFRKLRITWSVAWVVMAVLVCVLWVRSYQWLDHVRRLDSNLWVFDVKSYNGAIHTYHVAWAGKLVDGWRIESLPRKGTSEIYELDQPFEWNFHSSNQVATVPHWCLLIVAAAIAGLPWLPSRFSLRTLLIATTLAAVALGLIVWASR